MSAPEGKVVFLLGAGRSGSTLLELILDSHSQIRGLGELNHLTWYASESESESPQVCSYCDGPCSFWNKSVDWRVVRRFYSRTGLFPGLRRSWYRRFSNPFHFFLRWSDEKILIDSSKNIRWISRHLSHAKVWGAVRPMVLFLTRDGRAVTNAVLRKHPQWDMATVARDWKARMLANKGLFESLPVERRLQLAYEDLVADPETAARRICDWLQVAYQPGMLDYWGHQHHMMAGNIWTRDRVRKFQDSSPLDSAEQGVMDRSGTAGVEPQVQGVGLQIVKDERWRTELSAENLQTFDQIAGDLNRAYLSR
ncbi:MAG: sulfotransferase [Chromatiaceae bacterium]|nr:sulfotransferase [Chromatiaceae bacterium]